MFNNDSNLILEFSRMEKIKKFMAESNAIEGEVNEEGQGLVYANDVKAAIYFLKAKKITRAVLWRLHAGLAKPKLDEGKIKLSECGAWRTLNVRVGNYRPPEHEHVDGLMKIFLKNFDGFCAYEAHAFFETIHPFVDLNGRVGRLIWLWKKLHQEHFNFGLSFLHAYYYDSLNYFEKINNEKENCSKEETTLSNRAKIKTRPKKENCSKEN